MIVLSIIAYYIFAIGFIAAVVGFAVWQAKRRMDARFAEWKKDIERRWETPSLPPPLPPFEIDDEEEIDSDGEDEEADAKEVPDLNAPALQPIAPLLLR